MNAEYRVVIVDDSAFAQRVVTQHLADTEFKVVGSARSGKDAIDQLRTHMPDIALLDVILPDMTGVDILKQLMTFSPATKVIMVSSLGTEDTVTECLSLGAKAFVQKPVSREALLEQLQKLITV